MVVLAALGGWYWWSHPSNPISTPGNGIELSVGKVGVTYYFDTGISTSRSVRVTAVMPEFGSGSALAATGIVVCGPGGPHFGAVTSLAECANPRPLRDLRLTSALNGPWIAVAVTPLTPGVVHISDYRVVYQYRGTHSALSGIDTKVDARA